MLICDLVNLVADLVDCTVNAIHNMEGITDEAKAEEWLWKMLLQPLLLAVSR